ncbi:low temperature requirement protein A [Plantactinospora soyae]|uniref:Low temperature requirement protein LtrA n=1 Tax=Plantactinospora soyae TaxID=1544732 RepID=A0A927MBU6_9ACTN|nr:low temperature requirement protein A [Plantactinospora soyae]MBE1490266.1 low temperature requirement protein LtrA [Plantactinospora soyae]
MTFVELFFDLIYLLAVTQLTQFLRDHPTPLGMVQTLLMLLAIWWAWVDTTWVTNWFDPDQLSVRLMLILVAVLSLAVSASLPQAFDGRGTWFAGAYVTIQVGRTLFALVALGRPGGEPGRSTGPKPDQPGAGQRRLALRLTFQRLLIWKLASGAFWIAGAIVSGPTRIGLWAVAVLLEYAGATLGFRVPGLGRSRSTDWPINGWHLADRMQLFILIALGESILVTGKALGSAPADEIQVLAVVTATLGTAVLWWLYFDHDAEAARRVIDRADDPARLGRAAYSYLHVPMVAGIIVGAVGDELTIAEPTGRPGMEVILTVLGGPALFLVGHALFTRMVFGALPVPRLLAIGTLVALVPVGLIAPSVALAGGATLVLLAAAGWETVAAHRAIRSAS